MPAEGARAAGLNKGCGRTAPARPRGAARSPCFSAEAAKAHLCVRLLIVTRRGRPTASHFPAFISWCLICRVGFCTRCRVGVKPARGDQRGHRSTGTGGLGPQRGDRSAAVALSLRAHTHARAHTQKHTKQHKYSWVNTIKK